MAPVSRLAQLELFEPLSPVLLTPARRPESRSAGARTAERLGRAPDLRRNRADRRTCDAGRRHKSEETKAAIRGKSFIGRPRRAARKPRVLPHFAGSWSVDLVRLADDVTTDRQRS